MALIMYLTRAPRYKDITAKEIMLMESYFQWQHEKEIGSKYASETFEKWCSHSENELPDKKTINYYRTFFNKKEMYVEGIGKVQINSLFEQLARFVKTNHIFNWFIKNVMSNNVDKEYHEVTKEQLEIFIETCIKVKNSFTFIGKNKYTNEDEYNVNEDIAKELLPLMEDVGYFFGPHVYNDFYAEQVIKAIEVVNNILSTTDFKNQAIYFNATW